MPQLRFYNSYTKRVEDFTPVSPGKVSIYNCGPTVYKRQHIGNMRRYVFSDVLRRTLELEGYEVRDITNITDVGHLTQDDLDAGEDKLEKEARTQKRSPADIANEQTNLFFDDLAALNIEPAHKYPKATDHVEHMQDMIQRLIEAGNAYVTPTGVYYDVTTFPAYGKLSGNTLEAIQEGARVDVRSEKKNPADFALWIVNDTQMQLWDSPWGKGYPGWHIECSAMSCAYLNTPIDIHTGGIDNKFPHHENEIAQSEGALGHRFVNLWMHNSHLTIDGKKLAKREGEQITLDVIREKGFSPLALRLLIFASHYRSPIAFSWDALTDAQKHIDSITQLLRRLREYKTHSSGHSELDSKSTLQNSDTISVFIHALEDDLNTPEALAVFLEYVRSANTALDSDPSLETITAIEATLHQLDTVMGIMEPIETTIIHEMVPKDIQQLAHERDTARGSGDFEKADILRETIQSKGYRIEDTPSGPRVVKELM